MYLLTVLVVHKNQSTTVTPVNYISSMFRSKRRKLRNILVVDPDTRMSCSTTQMESDCNYPKKPCMYFLFSDQFLNLLFLF